MSFIILDNTVAIKLELITLFQLGHDKKSLIYYYAKEGDPCAYPFVVNFECEKLATECFHKLTRTLENESRRSYIKY